MQKNALILELLNNCRKIHACLTGTERLGKKSRLTKPVSRDRPSLLRQMCRLIVKNYWSDRIRFSIASHLAVG